MLRRTSTVVAAALPVAVALAGCTDTAEVVASQLEQGHRHLARRRYDQALRAFNRVLEVEPRHREARRSKAEILFNTARLVAASTILEALRREWPDDAGVVIDLGVVREKQHRFAEAIELFGLLDRASRPKLAWARALTGVGRHADAAQAVAGLLADEPWHETAYYLLSRIEFRRGRSDAAKLWGELHRGRHQQRQAERLARQQDNQGNPLAGMMLRAAWLHAAGRWHAAALQVQQATTAQPRLAPAYMIMGTTLSQLGHLAMAVQAFEESVALDPSKNEWRLRLAQERARYKAAGGKSTPPLAMARRYAAAGQLDRARATVLYMAERDPNGLEALRMVVELYDRPVDAFVRLWALRRAVKLAPDDPSHAEAIRDECAKLRIRGL